MEMMIAEVEGFLRRYGAALSAGDVASVGRCWQVPALVVADQGARAVLAMEEVAPFSPRQWRGMGNRAW